MNIKTVENKQEWENFITVNKPPTFLQSWNWGEFHKNTGYEIFRLGVYNNDVLLAIALTIVTHARRGSFLLCPHGPVITADANKADVLTALTQYWQALALKNQCHFVRVCPLLLYNKPDPATKPQGIWAGLLHKVSAPPTDIFDIPSSLRQSRRVLRAGNNDNDQLFQKYINAPIHVHPELSWILDITLSEEILLNNMRKTTRYSIRKAEKDGVKIEESNDPKQINQFWSVYRATVDRQHFTPFSKEYLFNEFSAFATDDQARWLYAHYNNEIVAAAMIVLNKYSGFYHHGASTQKYPQLTASHLLQWQAIKMAKERGCNWYNFWGIAPNADHPWAGLTMFKRGFGGEAQQYVRAKDLVLSSRYWLTYTIETIRKFKRGL